MTTFSERLKQTRIKSLKKQKDIAEYIGVPTPTYSSYEQGKSEPKYEKISMLADYFGVSTDYLLGRTDNPTDIAEVQIFGYVDNNAQAHAFEDLTGEEMQKLIDYADMMRKARGR